MPLRYGRKVCKIKNSESYTINDCYPGKQNKKHSTQLNIFNHRTSSQHKHNTYNFNFHSISHIFSATKHKRIIMLKHTQKTKSKKNLTITWSSLSTRNLHNTDQQEPHQNLCIDLQITVLYSRSLPTHLSHTQFTLFPQKSILQSEKPNHKANQNHTLTQ